MATLNVENLPDDLYRELERRALRERRSLAQEVIHLLSAAVEAPVPLSIMALRGLGKDLWRGTDAAGHVAGERDSWG